MSTLGTVSSASLSEVTMSECSDSSESLVHNHFDLIHYCYLKHSPFDHQIVQVVNPFGNVFLATNLFTQICVW